MTCTTISFTTIGLPVVLLCVYLLHYRVFTCCTTICLRFVLPCKELPQCLVSVELPSVRKRVMLPFVDVPPVGRMSARARLSGFPYPYTNIWLLTLFSQTAVIFFIGPNSSSTDLRLPGSSRVMMTPHQLSTASPGPYSDKGAGSEGFAYNFSGQIQEQISSRPSMVNVFHIFLSLD